MRAELVIPLSALTYRGEHHQTEGFSYLGFLQGNSGVCLFSMILLMLQTHSQTTTAADSFSAFVPWCYPKPRSWSREALPGCNNCLLSWSSSCSWNAFRRRENSQYQHARYWSSKIKLPIQSQMWDTKKIEGGLSLLVVYSKIPATLLRGSHSPARNQTLTSGIEDSELQHQYP